MLKRFSELVILVLLGAVMGNNSLQAMRPYHLGLRSAAQAQKTVLLTWDDAHNDEHIALNHSAAKHSPIIQRLYKLDKDPVRIITLQQISKQTLTLICQSLELIEEVLQDSPAVELENMILQKRLLPIIRECDDQACSDLLSAAQSLDIKPLQKACSLVLFQSKSALKPEFPSLKDLAAQCFAKHTILPNDTLTRFRCLPDQRLRILPEAGPAINGPINPAMRTDEFRIASPNNERLMVAKTICRIKEFAGLTTWEKRTCIHKLRDALAKISILDEDKQYRQNILNGH